MHTRTRRALPALVTALVSGALLLGAAPAGAARGADDPITVVGPFTVTGNGYGHGHGMSQWGAKGAALAGLSSQQILAFYYPNTTPASLATSIRVLITADTDNNLKVLHQRGLRVRDLGNGHTYRLHTKRTPRVWRLVQRSGHTQLFYKTGRWHLYKTGGRRSLAGDGEFRAPGGVTLKLASGTRKYRGALRFTNTDTVNVLNLEKYVRGVIAAEMPSSWPAEALGAQAVAARTYAARLRADNVDRYYQICDTTACQVYGGVERETDATNAAAAATAGQVLTYQNRYALTQFASSSGGFTSAGGHDYLTAHQDDYDRSVSPYVHWTASVDPAKLQARYPQVGTVQTVQIMSRESVGSTAEWGGWVQTVRVNGTTGSVDITGADFRSIYGLRSAYFTFDTVT
jgi:SpoIID/LytB domain protein